MARILSIYRPGASCVHACDAHAKIVLLAVYSAAIFFIDTWLGLALMLAVLVAVFVSSGVGIRPMRSALTATAFLMMLAVVFNGFTFDIVGEANEAIGTGIAGPSATEGLPTFALIGSLGITASGLAHGFFIALRILALVVSSLVVSLTTTTRELTGAFSDFIGPLRRFHVPTDDVAMVLSIALRFIPVVLEEFERVRDAMWSRGAPLDSGGVVSRMRAWSRVLVPVFVGLFRRAEALSEAMDARCYGMSGARRTSLRNRKISRQAVGVTIAGVIVFATIAALF